MASATAKVTHPSASPANAASAPRSEETREESEHGTPWTWDKEHHALENEACQAACRSTWAFREICGGRSGGTWAYGLRQSGLADRSDGSA